MTASDSAATRPGVRPPQLRKGALAALRLLETCPLVPVDAFVHLVGLSSCTSAYQQLARLQHAGLAEVRRVNLGYLVGERRIGLWRITDEGSRALRAAATHLLAAEAGPGGCLVDRGAMRRPPLDRDGDMPLLVAAYRVLALLVVERAIEGRPVDVRAWERPWVREVGSQRQGRLLRVTVPAGAVLVPRVVSPDTTVASREAVTVLLLSDLGTAPVARYREMLCRLLVLREAQLEDGSTDPEPELVIVSPDPDRRGTRRTAWLELLDSVARRHEQPAFPARVLGWERVADVVSVGHVPRLVSSSPLESLRRDGRREAPPAWRATVREQVLHLIGRHPFLTVDQLAHLLGTTTARIRRLEHELVASGCLRRIELDELPNGALGLGHEECRALGLVEITILGRRRLAGWLGLEPTVATRYHGLIGNARGQAGRRRRLLRTLAHTLGANAVFVAFAIAADAARRQGGTDRLADWRAAAACERRRCKPDGYGSFVRNEVAYGFLLEYDRGTESARNYVAKFRAYYWYRDSGRAACDYDGFPTLLFVTTAARAEQRIAEQAYRAWRIRESPPLPILITTTDRIAAHSEGILGPIWRTPASPVVVYWLSGGPPRGLYGAGREPVLTPRLVWPTASEALLNTKPRNEPAGVRAGKGSDGPGT
jgi:hypothetical protein